MKEIQDELATETLENGELLKDAVISEESGEESIETVDPSLEFVEPAEPLSAQQGDLVDANTVPATKSGDSGDSADAIDPANFEETGSVEVSLDQAGIELSKESLEDEDMDSEPPAPSLRLDREELEPCLESLLFVADRPLSLARLTEMLEPELAALPENGETPVADALRSLVARYQAPQFGIELCEIAGGFQFRTKVSRAPLAKKLAKTQYQRLSAGAMETLAIIAYKQPVLKEDIDSIRGVDSSYFLRNLLDRKLVEISGRSELPGRPIVYSTTTDFLQVFGLRDIQALPSLREVEQLIPMSEAGTDEDDLLDERDPHVREMRKLLRGLKSNSSSATLQYDPQEDEKILEEIRQKVRSIPTSTPFLDEQREAEKLAIAQQNQAAMTSTPEAMVPADPVAPNVPQGSGSHEAHGSPGLASPEATLEVAKTSTQMV